MSFGTDPVNDVWEVNAGWTVVTADGETLGVVEGVHPSEIIVNTIAPRYDVLFVPTEAVADIENDIVYLGIAMADISAQGWEMIPGDRSIDS